MKKVLFTLTLFAGLQLSAQQEVSIYKGLAPGSENWTQKEVNFYVNIAGEMETVYENVVNPKLVIYRPENGKANGTAVVICPGGGFKGLGWKLGGTDMAKWFTARGHYCFCFKIPDNASA